MTIIILAFCVLVAIQTVLIFRLANRCHNQTIYINSFTKTVEGMIQCLENNKSVGELQNVPRVCRKKS